ncbi:RsmE family RNA methyltransferase [Lapidilactobacillus gannanensis]|uniref:Ribosomal RNA small subunit methyltransferase E n=1 Tax=Lapidilactobacillus gannanensis TaxID=2486002 RepID=A0ABW4BSB4_9LACO|nr:RsmE family RNA methyltransferase [Lapidilactobacillus gannanensis]
MQLVFTAQNLQANQLVQLTSAHYQHVIQVLRQPVGAQLEVVGADQQAYRGEIKTIDQEQKSFSVQLAAEALADTELPVNAEIICGLPKREKTEWIVQKATELGASQIVFFAGQRSIMRWRPEQVAKKLARLQQIAASAAEQSHRRQIPVVAYWPNLLKALPTGPHNLVAYEEVVKGQHDTELGRQLRQLQLELSQRPTVKPTVRVIFGPEGGLAPAEVASLQALAVNCIGLGPRILRTETAPLYFLSSLSYAIEVESFAK